jgi:NDP-sugar pyrophosphorylase family protein
MDANKVKNINQAIILAGGRGERLRPITDNIPKVMIEINDKPFLQYQIEYLSQFGINDIILSVGYLWDNIQNHFGNGKDFDVNIKYSVEDNFLGTGGAIKLAQKLLGEIFFILNGDTYLPINYSDFESYYLSSLEKNIDIVGTLAIYTNLDRDMKHNVQLDPQNYILRYNKVIESHEMNGVDAGVTIFNCKIFDCIPDINKDQAKISFENDIWPNLIQARRLIGYKTHSRFYDIGTPERLDLISEVLK